MTTTDQTSPASLDEDGDGTFWALVGQMRAAASARLAEETEQRGHLERNDQEELGRAIILDLLEAAVADRVQAGLPSWTEPHRRQVAKAVFDALFRLGRLQPLIDDERVENIMIDGCRNVILDLADGSRILGPPVADSDEELIEFLVFLATRSQAAVREFSEANPFMDLRLDDGSRLAASAWVCPRPAVNIRRHRLVEVTLDDLVRRDLLTANAASFLDAAVRARKSIVVTGAQGAGKTTLARALCASIDPMEPIGTFETEHELFLHEMPEQHRMVRAWEHRPGTGETGIDGRRSGEVTLQDLIDASYRYGISRQIVGEVRGKEVLPMIKAMESGTGSISTTHATDATDAIHKLVTCVMENGPAISAELATAKLAMTIDLVVHIELTVTTIDGHPAKIRQVAEIVAVTPGEQLSGFATTHVYKAGPDGVARPGVLPDEYRGLARHGFDLAGYVADQRGPEVY